MAETAQTLELVGTAVKQSVGSLRKNLIWMFGGNSVYAGAQMALLIIIARLGTEADVGRFALATAICAPVFILAGLKLSSILAADALGEMNFGVVLALRIIAASVAFLIVAGFAILFGYGGEFIIVVGVVALAKAVDLMIDSFRGLQQQHEQMRVCGISLILQGTILVAATAIGMWTTRSLIAAVFGMLFASAATLAFYDLRKARQLLSPAAIRPCWAMTELRAMFLMALPMGLSVAVGSLNVTVQRFLIDRYLTVSDLGVFAALSYLTVAGSMIVAAIAQTATPRLAYFFRSGHRSSFLRLTGWMVGTGIVLGLLGVLISLFAGRKVLGVVYGDSYAAYGNLLLLIVVGSAFVFSYVFLGTALLAMGVYNLHLPLVLFGLVALIIATAVLTPRWGLTGAAWATVISSAVEALGFAIGFAIVWTGSQSGRPTSRGSE